MKPLCKKFSILLCICLIGVFFATGCGHEQNPSESTIRDRTALGGEEGKDDQMQQSPQEDCICYDIYAPVCGEDGQSYPNDCNAECAGVDIAHEGECTDDGNANDCICDMMYAPVCGDDGSTYSNACVASCAGVAIASEGECALDDDGCFCTREYAPVCGEDGNTYGNACEAGCAGAEIADQGACDGDTKEPNDTDNNDVDDECICYEIYAPVCGDDGQTYSNDCFAGCADVDIAHDGECGLQDGNDEDEGCFCTMQYDPVCGDDGNTYGNACVATCAKVAIVSDGECAE